MTYEKGYCTHSVDATFLPSFPKDLHKVTLLASSMAEYWGPRGPDFCHTTAVSESWARASFCLKKWRSPGADLAMTFNSRHSCQHRTFLNYSQTLTLVLSCCCCPSLLTPVHHKLSFMVSLQNLYLRILGSWTDNLSSSIAKVKRLL